MGTNMRSGNEAAGRFEWGAFSDDGSWSLATYRSATRPLLVHSPRLAYFPGHNPLLPRQDITKEMLP